MRLGFIAISLTLFLHPALFWFPKSIPFLKLGETIYDPYFKITKMSSFQAGMTKGWQKKLKEFRKSRAENSRQWTSISKIGCIHHYCSENGNLPDLIRFPVRVDNDSLRKKILRESDQKGFGIIPSYPGSIDGIQELKADFQGREFPVAKEHSQKFITLPVHSFITQNDVAEIAASISQTTHYEL
jgi:dTDP-4-amino-4,6-dideoxygalactose transaminase